MAAPRKRNGTSVVECLIATILSDCQTSGFIVYATKERSRSLSGQPKQWRLATAKSLP